ncbi:MAG: hypothetical protein QXS93_02925 [Candidatus Micrarchaeia archaeon]
MRHKKASTLSKENINSLLGDLLLDDCRMSKSKVTYISYSLSRAYFSESDVHTKTTIITVLSQLYEQGLLRHIPKPIVGGLLLNNDDAYQLFSLLSRHSPSLFANKIIQLLNCERITPENQRVLFNILENLVSNNEVNLKYSLFSDMLHSAVEQFALSNQPQISCEEDCITTEKLSRKAELISKIVKYYSIRNSDQLTYCFLLHQLVDRRFFSHMVETVKNSNITDGARVSMFVGLYLYLDWYSKIKKMEKDEFIGIMEHIYKYLLEEFNIFVFVPRSHL